MAIDLFSTRKRKLPDVFVYDELPVPLRRQMVHILEEAIGPRFTLRGPRAADGWTWLAKQVAHEQGLLEIPETPTQFRGRSRDWFTDCLNYVLEAPTEFALDLVELAMRTLEEQLGDVHAIHTGLSVSAGEAIADLNHRFRINGCGYEYANGKIVRVDSQLAHAEIIRPALALIAAPEFKGANGEFMAAHEHFRHGRIEAAVAEACKAFESTMKAIADQRRWTYDARATAQPLIRLMVDQGLVPSYSQEQLENVAKCLLGVATIRNKNSGHGAGSQPRDVPGHYAAYALHLAAANIVFLIECHHAMPR